MIRKLLLLFTLLSLWVAVLSAPADNGLKDTVTVYIFLQEECPICQSYTVELQQLHRAYAGEYIQFVGLFPSPESTEEKIADFKAKYEIPFELKTDHYHHQVAAFDATITPEVIVYNEMHQKILYRGRIDNTFFRVGKRRQLTTTSELKDALEAISNGKPVKITEAEAVGCVISQHKLSTTAPKCH